jgi:5-methylcytosine-specific restriction endonuclease McrA
MTPEQEELLDKVVRWLRKEDPGYCGMFPLPCLKRWLLDHAPDNSVTCAHCGLPLLSSSVLSFRNGTSDHLLPKSKYEWLGWNLWNAVPCCHRCNIIKGDYDPNIAEKNSPVYVRERDGDQLSEDKRKRLIDRSKDCIKDRLASQHARVWDAWVKACRQLDGLDRNE